MVHILSPSPFFTWKLMENSCSHVRDCSVVATHAHRVFTVRMLLTHGHFGFR